VDSNSVNKDDVLGSEDASLGAAAAAAARSLFGRAAPSGRSSSSKSTVFTLGNKNILSSYVIFLLVCVLFSFFLLI
jgi:hypothetical protein